jgi:hypothetical protein
MDDANRKGEVETAVAVAQAGSILYVIAHGQAAPARDVDAFTGYIYASELAEMGG